MNQSNSTGKNGTIPPASVAAKVEPLFKPVPHEKTPHLVSAVTPAGDAALIAEPTLADATVVAAGPAKAIKV